MVHEVLWTWLKAVHYSVIAGYLKL